MNHPYGASSSYMYANYGTRQQSRVHYHSDTSPQHFQSFIPRFSSDSIPYLSQSGTTEHIVTSGSLSTGTKNVYPYEDSLSSRTSLGVSILPSLQPLKLSNSSRDEHGKQ
ncbi:hypothetical protein BS17DRAFT_62098 [Gyrodon lividus]|nr:hypothetical protein BS17DRAFT_62098 [Gyrodon lividus]